MPRCPNSFVLLLTTIGNTHGMAIRTKCGKWSCPHCSKKLRKDKRELVINAVGFESIWDYQLIKTDAERAALHAQLSRNGKKLHFTLTIHGEWHIFHEAMEAHHKYQPDKQRWMSCTQVLAKFLRLLEMPGIERFSCCRAMIPPKPLKEQQWFRAGITKRSITAINQQLYMLNIDYAILATKPFTGELLPAILKPAIWKGPGNLPMLPDDHERLLERLSSPNRQLPTIPCCPTCKQKLKNQICVHNLQV